MTSLQVKKEGMSEGDRQKILKQMKVRTTLKKDKSWIHQQGSEDEKDEIPGPLSPQLKSLESRKSLWSPNPDIKAERRFSYNENTTSTTSQPSQPPSTTGNKRFSYNENSTSTTSQPSQPPSTTGNKPATSYIIRGQPVNAVSQVKTPSSFNGYQKSTVQARTTSLPRIPNATGTKISTEEYKKLAPYNLRNKSVDLSDDETPYTPQEQAKRTEQASGILRNTSSKDRSYVISAAKRNSGIGTQDTQSPFIAKRVEIQEEESPTNKKSQTLPKTLSSYLKDDAIRVEIQEEENTTNKKSQTLPKSLSSYLVDDANSYEKNWKEKQSKQTPPQTSPLRTTDRSTSPKMTSYSTSSTSEARSTSVKPEPAKITVVKESDNKETPKPATEKETTTTRTERVVTTENKSDSLPNSLAFYLYDDANRFEKNWQANQSKLPATQTSPPRVIDRPDSPKLTSWSTNTETRSSLIKPEPGKITRPDSPKLTSWSTNTETRSSLIKPEPGKITRPDSPKLTSWSTNTETRSTSVKPEPGKIDRPESPKLTSWTTNTETRSSLVKPEPGKIIRPESPKETSWSTNTETRSTSVKPEPGKIDRPESSKVTSWSTHTETRGTSIKPEPGKITVLTEESDELVPKTTTTRTVTTSIESGNNHPEMPKVTLYNNDIETKYTQTGPGKITVLREESTLPKPVPRMETKPKDTTVTASNNLSDLISWSDLDDKTSASNSRVAKEKTPTPTPVPRHTNKDSEKSLTELPLIVISPELKNNSPNQPLKPEAVNTVSETRYRVSEILDEPELNPYNNPLISDSGNRTVSGTTTETRYERSRTPEPKSERSSSPRPTPRPRENTTTTVTESRYRVPETLEDTMLESSPARSNSRTTVTTTRSTDPVYTEYLEEADTRSTRTVSSAREKITTTTTVETRYENNSSGEASQYDPQSGNKGVLFLKEYVNTRDNMNSPTSAGSFSDFSNDSDRVSYSNSSSYLYSSAPKRLDEGPCTYCGREIKDCAKIILEHLNIHCHEYCFKCGICKKPMGDLIDSLFIHRDVVHCESCYDKLF
ncbi:zinc finger protein 185 isoform X2 [Mixophyes fleayi]|uniref:zinc finger protein 185 isoform X2 n=1 Tax=Mixophyes fleayi TaxID=3061075 RepID=UPI003F4DEC3A